MSDHWVRCECGFLVFHKHTPSKLIKSMYEVEVCKHCYYDWLHRTTVNSLYSLLKKGFRTVKDKKFMDWEDILAATMRIYRNEDPIFIRECFKEASRRFMTHFNRNWARSLRSQE